MNFFNGITLVEIQRINELHFQWLVYLCMSYQHNSKTNTLKKYKFGNVDLFPIELLLVMWKGKFSKMENFSLCFSGKFLNVKMPVF